MSAISAAELAKLLNAPEPTDEQAAIIESPQQPAVIIAGAGSGKTETMAARVLWLVANQLVDPGAVLGLTFTRKAAGELGARIRRRLAQWRRVVEADRDAERLAALLSGEPTVLTYAAYAGRLVGEQAMRVGAEPSPRLLSQAVRWQLADQAVRRYGGDLPTDIGSLASIPGWVLALSDSLADHLVTPDQVERFCADLLAEWEPLPLGPRITSPTPGDTVRLIAATEHRHELMDLVRDFAAAKRRSGGVDYADQMTLAARLAGVPEVVAIERARFGVVLLDEYQDTGHAQVVMLAGLFGGGHPVTAVGDPFQSIYGWRGASAANLPRFVTDFPRPDPGQASGATGEGRRASGDAVEWVAARRFGLLTSFRNPPEVLELANGVVEPLREPRALDGVGELRAFVGAEPGDVHVALHTDVVAERAWLADAVADRWRAALDRGDPPPTSAVLVRRRADMTEIAAALRERDLPVEVVGLGGLLDEPEVRDLVSALRLVVDPLAGGAAIRLLTGARWRIGGADLAALWRRARELAAPPVPETAPTAGAPDPVADALPGEHAERAGLVDALDDPGPAERYSPAGYARLRRLARELVGLRRRVTAPLVDLVADVERTLLLDVEAAARPGEVGRAHLDAFADVVADFAGGATTSGGTATPTALLAYLDAAEEAEDGLTPGEVESTAGADPALGGARVQVLTVHAAKGLEWEVVAVPHVCAKTFPGPKLSGSWLTSIPSLPADLRGDRPDLPVLDVRDAGDRKELTERLDRHEQEFDERRLVEERRLFYVALTRAERTLLVSGYWWGESGEKPRGPSELLTEIGELAGRGAAAVDAWAEPPEEGAANPLAEIEHTQAWPVDPLGVRRDAVEEGAALVRAARERLVAGDDDLPAEVSAEDPGSADTEPADAEPADDPGSADPDGWAADVDVLLAERAAARQRHARVLLPPQLSVSQLVDLAADPAALARRLRRPVPRPPDPRARRGTEFHAWVERWFAKTELLEFDELPGAADEDPADGEPAAADLTELQERFTASRWATRSPVAVEVPFETEVEGTLVRGRIDAVFTDSDGGATVVDWKTGAPPAPDAMPALSVQLAAYRLAWAALSGTPVERVRAALHYVRADRTVTPSDLLDAAGLRALVASVPVEVREPEGDDVVPHPGPSGPWSEDDADPDR
ncbi:ATP-dependent DNA helicase, partial [Actinomycetospora sp.]|uniref:ATP-dependent helicase n=1 Tax=Actinomycetospora sp. TaxID=1872135 RepID=UPI002F3E727D